MILIVAVRAGTEELGGLRQDGLPRGGNNEHDHCGNVSDRFQWVLSTLPKKPLRFRYNPRKRR